jgi:O-antigen/teichoic acid export membrane protein
MKSDDLEDKFQNRYAVKLVANIISSIIGMITVAIIPTALGPSSYGYFSYLQQFFNQVVNFFDAGTSIAFFSKISRDNSRKELFIFYSLFASVLLIGVPLFLFIVDNLLGGGVFFDNIPNQYVYLGLGLSLLMWVMRIFVSIADAYAITIPVEILRTVYKVVSILTIVYLVGYTNFDLTSYFLLQYFMILAFIIAVFIIFLKQNIIYKGILTIKVKIKIIAKEFLDYCLPIVTYSSFGIAVSIFDIWSLKNIGGIDEVGFYNLSYAIIAMILLFSSSVSPIITREFSKYIHENKYDEISAMFHRYTKMLYSITVYFAVFISFQSDSIVNIFTDERFEGAIPVLAIMSFYTIHQVYGQICGGLFYATERVKFLRNINLIGSAIGLLTTIIFLYLLDLDASIGFALKMVIWQLIHVNILIYYSVKYLRISYYDHLLHQIYSPIFFIIIVIITGFIVDFDNTIINFLVSGVIYTVLVLIFLYIFPGVFSTTREEIKAVVNKFSIKR